MLTFIILGAVTLISITLLIIDHHKYILDDGLGVLTWIVGVICFVAMLLCTCTLINIRYDFDIIEEKYDNLKLQVEVYNNEEHNKVEAYSLREDVLEMNNTISEHKVKSKSPWSNVWYSEKIGNLDKISMK